MRAAGCRLGQRKAQVSVQGTWPMCAGGGVGSGSKAFPLPCLTFPNEGRTRSSPRGRAENPLLGLIVPRRACGGCAGHIQPGATHTQAAPARALPSPHPASPSAPPRPPGKPSAPWPPGAAASHPLSPPRPARLPHSPRPAGVGPARARQRPSSSSSSPPFLLQPARSPESAPRPCAQACPAPSPPGPGPGPPPPRRRTCPFPGRPRARDRDPAERSRRAASPCA